MNSLKTIGSSFVLISLLSACSSPQFIETATGKDLLKTNDSIYTLVNLHPDTANNRMYSVNYQQSGLIPRCSPVKISAFNGKILKFENIDDNQEYMIIKHSSSPDFPEYLNNYFGTTCDKEIIKELSEIDIKGVASGKVFVGMSKYAVILAIGYPPQHKTPSLKNDKWIYWLSRWDRFAIEFNKSGTVSTITD